MNGEMRNKKNILFLFFLYDKEDWFDEQNDYDMIQKDRNTVAHIPLNLNLYDIMIGGIHHTTYPLI